MFILSALNLTKNYSSFKVRIELNHSKKSITAKEKCKRGQGDFAKAF